ncbi:MAG: class I SAM-dependent methyltransferase [Hyphomicrobium sp.]
MSSRRLNKISSKIWSRIVGSQLKSGDQDVQIPVAQCISQDLDVYWDPAMAAVLEAWGEGNVWSEIQLMMAGRTGTCLDIACGTGKVMELLQNEALDIWGCDISDALIAQAAKRGLRPERLHVGDATKLPYQDRQFDHSYSIGSIEHFTEDGVIAMLRESRRVTSSMSFRMQPISRNGKDNGWIKTVQSYHNNSIEWWMPKYNAAFKNVRVLDSRWEDKGSVGKWFLCD